MLIITYICKQLAGIKQVIKVVIKPFQLKLYFSVIE